MTIHGPTLNACLNAASFILLITGWFFILRKNVTAHRICMGSACVTSLLFLVSYLTYHYHHGATRFAGTGTLRTVYFVILTSHTILAVIILPLIIRLLKHALSGDFEKHKKIARVTFPLWVYVSLTGVVVYWMLYRL